MFLPIPSKFDLESSLILYGFLSACHVEFPAIRAVYNNYSAGVEDITADNDSDAPAVYYDLQGRPVNAANLQPGIYLRHAGARTSKVIVKYHQSQT